MKYDKNKAYEVCGTLFNFYITICGGLLMR